MRRSLIAATVALAAVMSQATGQPPGRSPNPNNQYYTNVQLAVGKLHAESQQLAGEIAKVPPAVRRVLSPRNDQLQEQLEALSKVVAATPPRARLRLDFAAIDRGVKELIPLLADNTAANQNFQWLQSNLSAANIQLDFAIGIGNPGPGPGAGPGPGPGPGVDEQRELAKRLARQLQEQARALRDVARAELPPASQAQTEIRDFESASSGLTWALAISNRPGAIKQRFLELTHGWADVLVILRKMPPNNTERTRAQASRVDRTYRNLSAILDPNANPDPGFEVLPPSKAQSLIAIGAGEGMTPTVRLYQNRKGERPNDFMAYHTTFRGGVRVATGDVNGDGVADIVTAPGPGHAPLVRVFDGRDLSLIHEFLAYEEAFTGGVFVAVGNLVRGGRAEIVTGADAGGGPHVRVFDGRNGRVLRQTLAYDQGFGGGVRVAIGDVTGDGKPHLITAPGKGMEPLVRVCDGNSLTPIAEYLAYDVKMNGGVWVAAADFNRNGVAEVVTGADQGGPHVRVFRGLRGKLAAEFLAYDKNYGGGVRVAAQDVNQDGYLDIVTAPGLGHPIQIRVFDGRRSFAPMDEFAAFPPNFRGGAFISTR